MQIVVPSFKIVLARASVRHTFVCPFACPSALRSIRPSARRSTTRPHFRPFACPPAIRPAVRRSLDCPPPVRTSVCPPCPGPAKPIYIKLPSDRHARLLLVSSSAISCCHGGSCILYSSNLSLLPLCFLVSSSLIILITSYHPLSPLVTPYHLPYHLI